MGFFRYSLAVVRWLKLNVYLLVRVVSYARKVSRKTRGGRGYSIYPWVGRCGAAPRTLTLFKTNIVIFLPCLRQNSDF